MGFAGATSATTCSRRRFLGGLTALAAAPLLPAAAPRPAREQPALVEAHLAAAPAAVQLVPEGYPATAVWAYNSTTPGPVLRARQGDRLRISVENRLGEDTTVHWHGLRVPNAMDGVPVLTQPPIRPGERFVYEFALPDAGTFWYHPHQRSFEQIARGLAGAIVVEEREPPRVDRDLVWVLADWRLDAGAALRGGFGDFMDMSHAGRIGNTVTLNGRVPERFAVRAGERIRLRLINTASARIFALEFRGHRPRVIALDGQPVAPYEPADGVVLLAPAQRADIVLDMTAAPGSRHEVRDLFYRGREYRLLELAYSEEPALARRDAPVELRPNPIPEPDLSSAERHSIVLGGGMMGSMRGLPRGKAWAMNGRAGGCGEGVASFEPLVVLRLGRSYVLAIENDTAWHHPMHLHGFSFRVLSRNGRPSARREWRDTVLLDPRERVEIAFVADNPGDWLLHCHVLDHAAGGLTAVLRVT
ncbi:MAG: multicopper oxidase family protein [Pseudomonadota bacterium]